MPRLSARMPFPFGGSALASSASFTGGSDGITYDFAIGGMPFISAASGDNPVVWKTVPIRKDQQDVSAEPGEQSFAAWWLRAQSTFHGGAGQTFAESGAAGGSQASTQAVEHTRFLSGQGVDVWTQGKLSLLRTVTQVVTVGSGALMRTVTDASGNTCLLVADGTALTKYAETLANDANGVSQPTYTSTVGSGALMRTVTDASGNTCLLVADGTALTKYAETLANDANGVSQPTYTSTVISWAGAETILTLETDGSNYYVGSATKIYKGDVSTPASAATGIYNLPPGSTPLLKWVKQRLVLANKTATAANIYELDSNTGAGTALPTARFAHPNKYWTWTALAESPSAIYAGGYAGLKSAIYKFVLDSNGVMPALSTGITVAELPLGETVRAMHGYLGSYVGLVTTSGFRVALVGNNGDMEYGPNLFDQGQTITYACQGRGRWFYVGYQLSGGQAGMARVDLSMPLMAQQFRYYPAERLAWSTDLGAVDGSEAVVVGSTTGIEVLNDRMAMLVPSKGVYMEHPSKLVASGSLTTSRVRYSTLEPKLARFARLRTESGSGTIGLKVAVNSDGPGTQVITMDVASAQDTGDVVLTASPAVFLTLGFSLTRHSTRTDLGPTITGWQLKSLPAQRRQQYVILPLLCYDFETDRTGQQINISGSALSRFKALKDLENAGDVVTFQVLSPYAEQVYEKRVTIEEVQYAMKQPATDECPWGGLLTVIIRTVD